MRPDTLQLGHLRIQGVSQAGIETWFRVWPPGLAFEAGRGAPQLAGAADVFLSHGHLDHALGVAYVLSQRTRHQAKGTRLICPAEVAPELEGVIRATGRLERTDYDYELLPVSPGERVSVGRNLEVEAFATDHVVPSLGYHLVRRKHRLQEEFRGLPGHELARLRADGVATEVAVEELLVTYCGDTGAGLFDLEPRVFETQVLLLECTFLSPEKRESAGLYKHIHFEDVAARAERFANRAVVLHHLSRRHRISELRRLVDERLPGLAPRVHLLGEHREGIPSPPGEISEEPT